MWAWLFAGVGFPTRLASGVDQFAGDSKTDRSRLVGGCRRSAGNFTRGHRLACGCNLSGGTNPMVSLNGFLMDWILIMLYLGAAFGAQTFMATTTPDNFTDRIRAVLSISFFGLTVIGFMFFQLISLTSTQKILVFSSFVILSVLGWFAPSEWFCNAPVPDSPRKLPVKKRRRIKSRKVLAACHIWHKGHLSCPLLSAWH